MRADAGAREAAAGRHGRHHLAGLRVLRQRHAAERRADDRVVDRRLLHRDLAFGDLDLFLRRGDAGASEFDFGFRLVDVGSACSGLRRAAAPGAAASRAPPPAGLRFPGSSASPLRAAPRYRPMRRCGRGIVEAGEDLALADRHAFFDVHFDDLAGDLRRDRRATPRGDVARRVQHRRLRAGGALGDAATSTSIGRSRFNQYQPPPPAAATRTRSTTHFTQGREGGAGARSIRSADKSSFESITEQILG